MKRGLTEICYGFFSSLANPARLAILERLVKSDMNVTQIAEALGVEQSMISHNLKPLERCGIIFSKRRGKENIYKLNRETVESIFKTVEDHALNYCPFEGKCQKSH